MSTGASTRCASPRPSTAIGGPSAWRCASRTPRSPLTLTVTRRRTLPAWPRRDLERLLSLDVDGRGFAAPGRRDQVVGALQHRFPGLRPVLFFTPYEAIRLCGAGDPDGLPRHEGRLARAVSAASDSLTASTSRPSLRAGGRTARGFPCFCAPGSSPRRTNEITRARQWRPTTHRSPGHRSRRAGSDRSRGVARAGLQDHLSSRVAAKSRARYAHGGVAPASAGPGPRRVRSLGSADDRREHRVWRARRAAPA